jgi:hypothetical protein
MKSSTCKDDRGNIASNGDLLDNVIFGRPQIEVIEGVLPIGQLNQKQRYFLCLDFNNIESKKKSDFKYCKNCGNFNIL